jgi:hypothetical protein
VSERCAIDIAASTSPRFMSYDCDTDDGQLSYSSPLLYLFLLLFCFILANLDIWRVKDLLSGLLVFRQEPLIFYDWQCQGHTFYDWNTIDIQKRSRSFCRTYLHDFAHFFTSIKKLQTRNRFNHGKHLP